MARAPESDGPAALRIDETHPFLRERLAAVTSSFSWYHANHFGAAVDIAWCWLALGRVAEARALADELADGIPADAIHNLWSPASSVICLAARLARQANDAARHGELIVRIVTTRYYVTPAERHYLEETLAEARSALEPHRVPGPLERVCDDITEALSQAVYFAETLRAGRFRWQQWLSLDAVEALLSDGLQLLGDHLAGRIALPQRLDVAPIPEHAGILLVDARAIPADVHALWWIDLATGNSGRIPRGASASHCVKVCDSSAAWLFQVRDEREAGAVLVERTESAIKTTFTSAFV